MKGSKRTSAPYKVKVIKGKWRGKRNKRNDEVSFIQIAVAWSRMGVYIQIVLERARKERDAEARFWPKHCMLPPKMKEGVGGVGTGRGTCEGQG